MAGHGAFLLVHSVRDNPDIVTNHSIGSEKPNSQKDSGRCSFVCSYFAIQTAPNVAY